MVDNSSAKKIFLHGDLHLQIIEARNLPNMDVLSGHILRCVPFDSRRKDTPSGSGELKQRSSGNTFITSDPYVKVSVPQGVVIARTRVLKNSENPHWNERFNIPLAYSLAHLEFKVKDQDMLKASELLGTVHIAAETIATGKTISGWFPLKNSRKESSLRLEMNFIPCEKNPIYRHGIASDPEQTGIKDTYFPVRKGSQVKLYQDAHIRPESNMPRIELDDGKVFEHNSCWEDICHAISSATQLIYIVGWSIFHKVKLIREPTRPLPRGGDLTLGELLKYKSQEGVRVLLLVWDDITSESKPIYNMFLTGMMKTHDEETRKFFKHSSVVCVLSPRYGDTIRGRYTEQVVKSACTHHQKCVLVDTQAYGNNRKITAFIGGLDLTDGRYDTPEHRLFHDLDTVFKDDIHQPTFSAGTKAPRQPWHDLHCKIDGHAAYDVLLNFEQRWRKAANWTQILIRMARSKVDKLLKIDRIPWMLSPKYQIPPNRDHTIVPEDDPLLHVSNEDDPDSWHVQIFRSIDSMSLKGFPKNVDVAQEQNLVTSRNMVIEKSIQTAYIQAIRSAQHFIYIENQYFIGSSYEWPSYKNAGANNLIPMELAQKIASKIRSKERFAVYVVIPMWPEGDPTSSPMQEMLYWQSQTMQMMYNVVALAIKSMQIDAHPKDYLNFYCLGKREDVPFKIGPSFTDEKVSDSQKFNRFMIYVHSKGMIVDDEYVIVGSANINERSLAGSRDTEIAMCSYQPHHTWAAKKRHPYGQVYGYRMSLWAEHLGAIENAYKEPQTLECVNEVNKVAEDNWKRYTDEKHTA
nr:phospholipase D delta [Tanacetum cinerariifolium]